MGSRSAKKQLRREAKLEGLKSVHNALKDEGKEKRYVSWLFQNVLILITQPRLRVLDP